MSTRSCPSILNRLKRLDPKKLSYIFNDKASVLDLGKKRHEHVVENMLNQFSGDFQGVLNYEIALKMSISQVIISFQKKILINNIKYSLLSLLEKASSKGWAKNGKLKIVR